MSNPRSVGIDLGTTYSAVAYVAENGRTAMVRNAEGELLTPSVVLFERSEIVVGKEAKKVAGLRPEAVAQCAKRDMGKAAFAQRINGELLPPEVIQACILKKLKNDASAALGDSLRVVITVPAYFDDSRRKSTADAGEMAGLDVLDIVNEPTAAALSFGETLGYLTGGTPRAPLKVLVYDLGGGTFDVTLIDLRPGDIRTLATDGDVELGGHDWDLRLANFAAEQHQRQYGTDVRQNPSSLVLLLRSAEEAKHTLSARQQATIHVQDGSRASEVTVTRAQFEELTADLLERTSYTTRQVLAATHHGWKDIQRVLLVGGSTRMPMVAQMLKQMSGIEPDHSVNPDEAVARGAAIFAEYILSGRGKKAGPNSFRVVDVNAHSLGIEGIDTRTDRKLNMTVIPRNTPLPTTVAKKCVTKVAGQQSVVVQVLEGESSVPAECSHIGRAVLRGLPTNLPQGAPIDVTYEYRTNGRLDVRARLPNSSNEVLIELERENGLSNQAIGRWRRVVSSAKGFDSFEALLEGALKEIPPSDTPAPVAKLATLHVQPVAGPLKAIAVAEPASAPGPAHAPLAMPVPMAMPVPAARPAVPIPMLPAAQVAPLALPVAAMALAPNETPRSPAWKWLGFVLIALVGITLGYYILAVATPVGNVLRLKLPGLPHSKRAPVEVQPQNDANATDAAGTPASDATKTDTDKTNTGKTDADKTDAATDASDEKTDDSKNK